MNQQSRVKTDHDLLEEFTRYVIEGAGMSPPEVDLWMHNWRTQLMPNMKRRAPKPMTDAEYSEQLKKLKTEAPAYLHFLLNTEVPELPGKFRGENN